MEEAIPKADIWPDNVTAVNVFVRMLTQWRVGFGGAYGLDYNALPIASPREFNSPEWPDILECIRVMEESALETMQRSKK